jgi:response regulator of citrate/malate metabolism
MAKTSEEKARDQVLGKVGKYALQREAARISAANIEENKLVPAMEEAAALGITLRDIGEAAGVSHVTVRRMLQRHGVVL